MNRPENDIQFYDSREQIDKCLSCPRTECINCFGSCIHNNQPKRSKIDHAKFMKLYNRGMSDGDIGKAMNKSRYIIRHYRESCGLEPKHKGRKKNGAKGIQ